MVKNKIKAAYIFYAGIIILSTSFIIVHITSFSSKSGHNRIVAEHLAFRIMQDCLEAYARDEGDKFLVDNKKVIGFGLYYSDGKSIATLGKAPQVLEYTIPMHMKSFRNVMFDRRSRTLTMIEPVRGMHRKMILMGNRNIRTGRYLLLSYIELDISQYYRLHMRSIIVLLLIPLLLAFLIILLIISYNRNARYREKIESQKHLVTLGEVSRTLAHEIKNPLGAIKIQTGYLKKILPEAHKADLAVIDEEIERLNSLTMRIGDFLRDPVGKQEEINILQFFSTLQIKFMYNIKVNSDCGDDITLLFDRARLTSIFENILVNAMESMEELEPEAREILIRVECERHELVIKVIDIGCGLPEHDRERIFDPFYTSKITGSGLGLAITKRFVEATGARIEITPNEPVGTCVTLGFKKGYSL